MTESKWLEYFGDNLANMMREVGISQRELADEAGLSEATISYYIRKQKMPSAKAILNISYALGCEVSDLIDFGERIEA